MIGVTSYHFAKKSETFLWENVDWAISVRPSTKINIILNMDHQRPVLSFAFSNINQICEKLTVCYPLL